MKENQSHKTANYFKNLAFTITFGIHKNHKQKEQTAEKMNM